MKASAFTFKGGLTVHQPSVSKRMAFTLIELLVVIATLAVLAAMLLPALAGTQSQSKVTACTARFRQWAVSANLYANDNRGWLPSFNPVGGGEYARDVGTNMLNALYAYGMNVPDWFCPMRPNQWDAANQWVQQNAPLPSILNINLLTSYFSRNFPLEFELNDNYWVPRSQSGTSFPVDFSGRPQTIWPIWLKNQPTLPTSAIYGWPQRLHDIAASQVPFVSDSAGSAQFGGLNSPYPASSYVTNIAPNTAHFVNGTLIGVNLAFADGHVEGHDPSQMRAVYASSLTGPFWFY
ncbi:MAG TPA: prepilin-type N-terminal cleavage/methylation domain-containing protein [Verrucomicrobiae bacterium]|nr:prepilin-type N-terminal cleavage/methylation domain-containing protein [Verrucomicrobiae bacterium]